MVACLSWVVYLRCFVVGGMSVIVLFMGIMRVLIGHWSNMGQIKDNSFKDRKHTGQQIGKHVNQTTTT